jgi:hypothetical protein
MDFVASLSRAGEVAQLVEHTTENRGVPGSIPGLAIRTAREKSLHSRDFSLDAATGTWAVRRQTQADGVKFEVQNPSPSVAPSVSKTVRRRLAPRGFEPLPLRYRTPFLAHLQGIRLSTVACLPVSLCRLKPLELK